jgi:hypothetical protein
MGDRTSGISIILLSHFFAGARFDTGRIGWDGRTVLATPMSGFGLGETFLSSIMSDPENMIGMRAGCALAFTQSYM